MSEITKEELSAYNRLTQKQRAFVDAFIEYGEGEKAAEVAGYISRGYASRHLLKNMWVRRALRDKGADMGPSVAKPKEVLQTLTEEMRSAPEPKDRIKAAELLGKRYGMFITRQEISGKDGKPIEVKAKRDIDYSKLSTDELRQLESLLTKALPGQDQGGVAEKGGEVSEP
jgi:phage terminase small subunit